MLRMTHVRALQPTDWPSVEAIYREGIATGHATFEPEPPTWSAFDTGKHPALRLIAEDEGRVLGWAAASPVSSRPVYAGVVEHSLYVSANSRGTGTGTLLLQALLNAAGRAGIWTMQSSIFPENTASLALHRRAGFRDVGTRERIALMTYGPLSGTWRDTILVEHRIAL
jgi:L-amino acid N-acyltransferase YncA